MSTAQDAIDAEPLVELVVRVPAEHEDTLVEQVGVIAPGGFRAEVVDGVVECGVYVEAANAAVVHEQLVQVLADLDGDVDVSVIELPVEPGWAEGWKRFHRAVQIGRLWVGPPWLEPEPGLLPMVIEPGQGFGTGAHPTTHLVLDLLQSQARCSVFDIGCGSGVLSVAAALLGFGPITAIDNDPVAITSAQENLARNGVQRVRAYVADGLVERLPEAELVLANIMLAPLVALAPRLRAPRVIVSGLLRSQVEDATFAFETAGYVVRERRDRESWTALVLDSIEAPTRVPGGSIV